MYIAKVVSGFVAEFVNFAEDLIILAFQFAIPAKIRKALVSEFGRAHPEIIAEATRKSGVAGKTAAECDFGDGLEAVLFSKH